MTELFSIFSEFDPLHVAYHFLLLLEFILALFTLIVQHFIDDDEIRFLFYNIMLVIITGIVFLILFFARG